MIAALCEVVLALVPSASARARNMSASVSPAPKAPIFRKPRRLMPSQNFCFAPQIVNIVSPLCTECPPGETRIMVAGTRRRGNGNPTFFTEGYVRETAKRASETLARINRLSRRSAGDIRGQPLSHLDLLGVV